MTGPGRAGRIALNVLLPIVAFAALAGAWVIKGSKSVAQDAKPAARVRVGYLVNLTHAQALVGLGRGDFALKGVTVEGKAFNAGPSVIEALFAGEIDLAYIGPGPALNAFAKSGGEEVRLLAGSAANGVVLVVHPSSGIRTKEDLRGKRIATPQYGNTQDIAARSFVTEALKSTLKETVIHPVENPDILALFKKGELDAAWVPEPWGSRLVAEAGATVLFEEKELWPEKRFATTVLIARRGFLEANPQLVRDFVAAHERVTAWVREHPAEASAAASEAIQKITGKALPAPVLASAWNRIEFTSDPLIETVSVQAERALSIGFLKSLPDLRKLQDLK